MLPSSGAVFSKKSAPDAREQKKLLPGRRRVLCISTSHHHDLRQECRRWHSANAFHTDELPLMCTAIENISIPVPDEEMLHHMLATHEVTLTVINV